VCKRQQGEGNTLAKSACLDCLSHGCTAPIEHMSSLYARATAARPKAKQQTSRGRLGSIYLLPAKIPPPEEASDRPARDAPPSVVTDLAARSRSLPLRFLGDYHHHHGGLSQWTGSDSDLTPFFCHFASFRMDRSGKRVSTCLFAACGSQQNTQEPRLASRRRFYRGGTLL
jgi:hypothetical protein